MAAGQGRALEAAAALVVSVGVGAGGGGGAGVAAHFGVASSFNQPCRCRSSNPIPHGPLTSRLAGTLEFFGCHRAGST